MATPYSVAGLPHAPFAIGTEFGGTADLSHEILGTHHRRFIGYAYAYQTGSRTRSPCCRTNSSIEVRPDTWDPSCMPVSDQPGRRTLRSADQSASRTTRQALDSRQPSFPGCRSPRLERPAEEITSSSSQMIFCRRLKAWLSGHRSQISLSDLRLLYLLYSFILLALR